MCAREGIFPVEVAILPSGDCVAPTFMSPKVSLLQVLDYSVY